MKLEIERKEESVVHLIWSREQGGQSINLFPTNIVAL